MPRQFDVPFDGLAVSVFAHELEAHPKLQRIEPARAHLAVTEEVVLRVIESALLGEVIRRHVERVAQHLATVTNQRGSARERNEYPLVRIKNDRVSQFDAAQFLSMFI